MPVFLQTPREMKPVIGIMPLWDEQKESLWMLPGYMDAIRESGGLSIMLPLTSDNQEAAQLFEICDGLLFTGGQDVNTDLYGEEPLPDLVHSCRERDNMELNFLPRAIVQDKPVLGICRGLQFINAALGGTLYQDIELQHPSPVSHRMKPPYDGIAHSVSVMPNTVLHEVLEADTINVNSCHHQGIHILAESLIPMAYSEDGLIEAFCMPDHRFLWAVQWHPEFSYENDANSRKIFQAFVDACQN